MERGIVLPLTQEQRIERMKYIARLSTVGKLDEFVRGPLAHDAWPPEYTNGWDSTCADIYYLLEDYNGGKDPTAIDFATRWRKKGKTFVNRTADCMGAMAWCGGFDRLQPQRFKHLYKGYINTDSMIMDAKREQKCFRLLDRPVAGCFVVIPSGAPGHKVGHIGGAIEVPDQWAGRMNDWKLLKIVDQAKRDPRPGNGISNPLMWFRAGAVFVESIMVP